MIGIEPMTSSFAYTSTSLYKRARLYLNPIKDSLVSRSGDFSPRSWPLQAINRYSGFIQKLLFKWAGHAAHHGCALPTELHWLFVFHLQSNCHCIVVHFLPFFNLCIVCNHQYPTNSNNNTYNLMPFYLFTIKIYS